GSDSLALARPGGARTPSDFPAGDIMVGRMPAPGWTVEPEDPNAAQFALALGVHPLTAALLRRRGVASADAAHRFLHPTLDELSDPGGLPGMVDAVACVAQALAAGRRIAIHGDYDVDGISATAILLRGLRALGADPLWYLPHRFHDGYGLGIRAVETLARTRRGSGGDRKSTRLNSSHHVISYAVV